MNLQIAIQTLFLSQNRLNVYHAPWRQIPHLLLLLHVGIEQLKLRSSNTLRSLTFNAAAAQARQRATRRAFATPDTMTGLKGTETIGAAAPVALEELIGLMEGAVVLVRPYQIVLYVLLETIWQPLAIFGAVPVRLDTTARVVPPPLKACAPPATIVPLDPAHP